MLKGMAPAQAHRHHVLKMDLCDDIYGQAHHAINPSKRAIQYMFDVWRKRKLGGLNTPTMFDAIQKYAENNPDIILRIEHSQGSFCMILITPFMMRAHRQLKEAGEVVFVDATSCVDQLNTVIIPFLCAGPAGAVPLALVFTSSQDGATLTKGFGMVKEALGGSAFYGRGEPQCFMTDNCGPERKALATTWPKSKLFLCIFHILQQVWRWLLDSRHGIHKLHRQELMGMMKSLVYAKSRDEFGELWKKAEANSLLEKYPKFRSYLTTLVQRREEWAIAFRAGVILRGHHTNNYAESTMSIIKDTVLNRCKAYNTTQLMVFMVEIFDCYMRQRLVDVALGRQRVKSITVDKIAIAAVKSFGSGLYSVQSQSDQTQVYEVDLTIGMCTCMKGQDGAICKHQIACADYSMTAVPQMFVMTSSSRQSLAALAVGPEKAPKESFFKGLTEVEDNENESNGGNRTLAAPALAVGAEKTLKESLLIGLNEVEDNAEESNGGNRTNKRVETNARELENTNENIADDTSDLTAKSKLVAEALIETTAQYGNSETEVALQKFLRRIRSVKTTNQLNNLLNCAGSSMTFSGAGRGKIPCQPATIARRSPGMPRGAAPIGKGRRPASVLSSNPKRPRNLARNVQCNVANAKSHGSGH